MEWATANGTAIGSPGGFDYISASGTVTFQPGDVSEFVTITIIGDNVGEPNETFFVNLTSPVNATITDNQGEGTIVSDD